MSTTLSKVFIFTLGAAVGSFVTWKIVKTKYKQIAQEEIDSVIEKFAPRKEYEPNKEGTDEEEKVEEYFSKVEDLGYTNYSGNAEAKGMSNTKTNDKKPPYVIPPEEFGEKEDEGYETETLFYYTDGVLADEADNEIEDVESVVGCDSLTRFGEYEDDSVFVRNEQHRTDYEILLSLKCYWSEVVNRKPHLAEGE